MNFIKRRVISSLGFPIKYGLNPHQGAKICKNSDSNIKLINGIPSYINYLDAIQSWNLISSIKSYEDNKIISTSFKHTTPTGLCLNDSVSEAFINCRNIDPLSSYGNFIAISDTIDKNTAKLIKNVVSDGIIALDYTDEALEILKSKKKGKYIIFKGKYSNLFQETREINGIKFILDINNYLLDDTVLKSINDIQVRSDSKLAYNILKFIPSNSVTIAYNNKVIGVGAGQQNRVDCIKIAGEKALNYLERNNLLKDNIELILASDGFLPFEDNIIECLKYNIKYIVQPGGSIRDNIVKDMCKNNNIKLINTGKRMFYH